MTCRVHRGLKMKRTVADSAAFRSVRCRAQAGLVLLALVLALALGAVASLIAAEYWATTMQREREAQLLFVGDQYRRAIVSYYLMSPTPVKVLPRALDDLVADQRFPMPVQHLRRLYPDPINVGSDWGLVKLGAGIAGVYSTSEAAPLKKAGFPAPYQDFEAARTYSQWRFAMQLPQPKQTRPDRPKTVTTQPLTRPDLVP